MYIFNGRRAIATFTLNSRLRISQVGGEAVKQDNACTYAEIRSSETPCLKIFDARKIADDGAVWSDSDCLAGTAFEGQKMQHRSGLLNSMYLKHVGSKYHSLQQSKRRLRQRRLKSPNR